MERIVEQGLLYDFYGELLTDHQKKIYESVVYQDMSLGEIAQEYGISRQGVHDLVKRCDYILQEYEKKLRLVDRFIKIRSQVNKLQDMTKNNDIKREELFDYIELFSHQILEEL